VGVDLPKATLEVALDDKRPTEPFANNDQGIAALLTATDAACCAADGGDYWSPSTVAGVQAYLVGFEVILVNPR